MSLFVMLNKTIIVILINKLNCKHVLVFELILNRITFESVTDFLKHDYSVSKKAQFTFCCCCL